MSEDYTWDASLPTGPQLLRMEMIALSERIARIEYRFSVMPKAQAAVMLRWRNGRPPDGLMQEPIVLQYSRLDSIEEAVQYLMADCGVAWVAPDDLQAVKQRLQ